MTNAATSPIPNEATLQAQLAQVVQAWRDDGRDRHEAWDCIYNRTLDKLQQEGIEPVRAVEGRVRLLLNEAMDREWPGNGKNGRPEFSAPTWERALDEELRHGALAEPDEQQKEQHVESRVLDAQQQHPQPPVEPHRKRRTAGERPQMAPKPREPREGRGRFLLAWRRAVCGPTSPWPPNARLVLMVLANYMRGDGTGAFPSQETLARDAGLSVPTVRKYLRAAIETKWLKRANRVSPNGAFNGFTYTALMPQQEHDTGVKGYLTGEELFDR